MLRSESTHNWGRYSKYLLSEVYLVENQVFVVNTSLFQSGVDIIRVFLLLSWYLVKGNQDWAATKPTKKHSIPFWNRVACFSFWAAEFSPFSKNGLCPAPFCPAHVTGPKNREKPKNQKQKHGKRERRRHADLSPISRAFARRVRGFAPGPDSSSFKARLMPMLWPFSTCTDGSV